MIIPVAALLIGGLTLIALVLQGTLWVRYVYGTHCIHRWGVRLTLLDHHELQAALMTASDCKGWCAAAMRKCVAALGLSTRQFRIEYTLGLLEESEERLVRSVFIRFCHGSMMILGLAGTFFAFIQLISSSGLTNSLRAISNGQDVATQYTHLSTAFLKIYDGFGQAFISSLAGLAATLVLGLVDQLFVAHVRRRFLHEWVHLAHDWEQRLQMVPQVQEAEATSDKRFAPPSVGETIEPALIEANQQEASANNSLEVLIQSLENSKGFYDACVKTLEESAKAHNEEMQKMVAGVVVAMRQVVEDVGKEVKKVSEAKSDHLKKVDDSIQEHFSNRERIWQKKLEETLGAFQFALQEATKESRESLSLARKDSLEAGERVAKAVKDEARQALDVVTDNQKSALQSQQALTRSVAELSTLVHQVTGIVQNNKEATEKFITELTLSLKAWKNAPKSVDEALQKTNDLQTSLGETIDKLAAALQNAAQMPNRWETEIKNLSGLFSEVSERRRADSVWGQLQTKAKESIEWLKEWLRSKRH